MSGTGAPTPESIPGNADIVAPGLVKEATEEDPS